MNWTKLNLIKQTNSVSLTQGRFTWRHNSVLNHIASTIQEHKPSNLEVFCDIAGQDINGGTIPPDILVTQSRPDLVLLNRTDKTICLLPCVPRRPHIFLRAPSECNSEGAPSESKSEGALRTPFWGCTLRMQFWGRPQNAVLRVHPQNPSLRAPSERNSEGVPSESKSEGTLRIQVWGRPQNAMWIMRV